MHLGNKLRRMRQARGLTAVELAQRARVTTGFISQLEHSQTVPSLQTLQRIAAVLGVSLTYFFLEEHLQPQVVRQQERQIIHLGQDGSRVSLLSPQPARHLELALFELPSGAVSWSTARCACRPAVSSALARHGPCRLWRQHLSSGRGG